MHNIGSVEIMAGDGVLSYFYIEYATGISLAIVILLVCK
jgi:hypothetical protein